MNVKKAYELLMKEMRDFKAIRCFEYDSLFVFDIVHKSVDVSTISPKALNTQYSVNKKSGEVRDFKPFFISLKEYRNGKEVKKFN